MCYITFSLSEGIGANEEARIRALLDSLGGVLAWGRLFPDTSRPYYSSRYFVQAEDTAANAIESGLRSLPFVEGVSEPAQRELILPTR